MPPKMAWLILIVRLAITPVFLGALVLWAVPQRSGRDIAAGVGLALLGGIHLRYWMRPWPTVQRRAVVAGAAMVLANVVLLYMLDLSQPLVWLYPALVVGAGLRPPVAIVGVGLMAVSAVVPVELTGTHQFHVLGSANPMLLAMTLGSDHAMLLAVALAGLGMTAVRQLIAANLGLEATRAELAELAVAADRERLARELHDVLGRTLALIAVKVELAGRLSASGDAAAELHDVQRLARAAIGEVRDSVAGSRTPNLATELAAAPEVLQTVGIRVSVDRTSEVIDPRHEAMVAWALREAVTNVVKHSGARSCRISLQAARGVTTLEVDDDGRGAVFHGAGTGLNGLARRIHALGGTFEAGPVKGGGFRVRVRLDNATMPRTAVEVAQ